MPMTEEEALIRAREAAIAGPYVNSNPYDIRSGRCDNSHGVQAALRALLDLDKPLPVDRDLADLRELFANEAEDQASDHDYRTGLNDHRLKRLLPTFRAIIQRRIDEIVELGK